MKKILLRLSACLLAICAAFFAFACDQSGEEQTPVQGGIQTPSNDENLSEGETPKEEEAPSEPQDPNGGNWTGIVVM